MEKAHLTQELIKQLLEQADVLARSSKTARQASIDAPGRMESRYDSTKSEQDWLSRALASSSAETRDEIRAIKAVNLAYSESVKAGSVVVVRKEKEKQKGTDENWAIERYFVLPAGSGTVLQKSTAHEIVVVTPQSPIGGALMGHVKGDCFDVRTPKGLCCLTLLSVE